jgi:hypothetical protein
LVVGCGLLVRAKGRRAVPGPPGESLGGQRHFVDVCRGRAPPSTDHEFAYCRFKAVAAVSGVTEDELAAAGFVAPSPGAATGEELDSPPAAPKASSHKKLSGRRCRRCLKQIPVERVRAIPGVELCVPCQGVQDVSVPSLDSGVDCPRCACNGIKAKLVWRVARDPERSGYFLGCSRFPECRYIDRD